MGTMTTKQMFAAILEKLDKLAPKPSYFGFDHPSGGQTVVVDSLEALNRLDFSDFVVTPDKSYFGTIRQFMGSCACVASGECKDPKVGAKALVEYSILHPEIKEAPAVKDFFADWPQYKVGIWL